MAASKPTDLTPAEAAERSGFCVKTVYRAIWDKELVARKVRSRLLITEGDFEDWYAGVDVGRASDKQADDPLTPLSPAERGLLATLRAIEDEAA